MDSEAIDDAMKLLDAGDAIVVHQRNVGAGGGVTGFMEVSVDGAGVLSFTEVWIQPLELNG